MEIKGDTINTKGVRGLMFFTYEDGVTVSLRIIGNLLTYPRRKDSRLVLIENYDETAESIKLFGNGNLGKYKSQRNRVG